MIGATPQKVRWVVKAGKAETVALLDAASRTNGFKLRSNTSGLSIEIPRSLRKRRPAARLAGSMAITEDGTEIHWDCGPDMKRASDHLADIEAAFPEGRMHYHGMVEVSAEAGLVFEGSRTFRAVADSLESDEWVLAVAKGRSDEACVLVLTERRVLLVADGPGHFPLLDAPLDSIAAMTLGKKRTGETLRVSLPRTALLVTHLGHGEGHCVASTFRLRKQEMARTRPLFPNLEH
jgi:hypothetical protein